jgi:hypothetical protein
MTHDEARELIGGDPDVASPELLEHLKSCPECQAYREQMIAFNAKLRRALDLDWQKVQRTAAPTAPLVPKAAPDAQPAPPPAADRSNVTVLTRKAPTPVVPHKRPRLFAFGASLAAALVVGFTLWLSRPATSLAAEIVTHVEGEPNSWHKTQPVPAEQLEAVLRKSGVKLGTGMEPVVYANSCWFRGHFVPHMVVTTEHGPVTVMILLHEQVPATRQFNEDGFTGLLVPAGTGSVAVISHTPMALDQPASDVVHALQSAH